jgi:ABC-type sugar transport system substrate-binding protein
MFRFAPPIRSAACLGLLSFLASCAPPAGESTVGVEAGDGVPNVVPVDGREVVLLAKDLRAGFDLAQSQILQSAVALEAGYVINVEDALGVPYTQVRQFREAIERDPEVILLDPVDATLLDPVLDEALQAGVQVISLCETIQPPRCLVAVFCEESQIGTTAGQLIVEALRRKAEEEGEAEVRGRVVEIRGLDDDVRGEARHRGFTEALKQESGIVLVHDAPGDGAVEPTEAALADAYRLQHQFDVIYAHDDLMGSVAGGAAVDQGVREHTFIVGTNGFGGGDRGQDLMRRGEIDATIFHPIPADFAWRLLKKMREEPDFRPKPIYKLLPGPITHWNLQKVQRGGLPPYPAF